MSWSKEETLKLIAIWADDRMQALLEGCHHNRDVYERMAKWLGDEGYKRTYQQCHEKLLKLKAEYRKKKDKQGKTGENRSRWEFFDAIDEVLGHKPATQPLVVLDTLADAADTTDISNEEDSESTQLSESTSTSLLESSDLTPQQETGASSATGTSTPITNNSKKHKRSRSEAFELALGSVVESWYKHKVSEARLLAFEEEIETGGDKGRKREN